MTRKQIVTSDPSDPAEHHGSVTPASIQYVRTGARRRTARKVSTVRGVRPFFA